MFKATAPSTATVLRDEGYLSAYFGKWHCGVVRDQVPRVVRENRVHGTVSDNHIYGCGC